MTIGLASRKARYVGNGVTATFAVPFPFFEIDVYTNSVLAALTSYTVTQTVSGQPG
jgi:hypothetical protein